MTRHPILSILMAVAGVILLLPGVCAAGFIALVADWTVVTPTLISLWLVCLLISAGGGWLLYKAFQKPPNPMP